MGVFDVPAPLFVWTDQLMSQFASPALRVALWGIIGAAVSMGLYWLVSPQAKIKRNQAKTLEARRALDAYEGDFAGAWPQMRNMLGLALKQVGIVVIPAILASLPVLCMLVWMSSAYGYEYPPPGVKPAIRTHPQQVEARWVEGQVGSHPGSQIPRIELIGEREQITRVIPLPKPVPTVHQRQWWNALFGNPAGYLPDNATIDRVEIDLPSQELFGFGPRWIRGWEFLFLMVLLVSSIVIKVVFKIK
jgi:hypothetical protein